MLERLTGTRRGIEGNGHLAEDANLILDSAQLRARPSAWDAVQAARNIKRPHALDVITRVFDRFQELHGDRGFRDDPAIVGGIGELAGRPVVIVGQQKGASTEENIERNFGMPHPEGYRKAIRLYRLAEKFHLPLVTLVDTPGAYPGPEGEERGQAEAGRAGTAMRFAGPDLLELGIVDALVPEPEGGAPGDHERTAAAIKVAIVAELANLERVAISDLLAARYERFRKYGAMRDATTSAPPPAAPWWRKLPRI